MKVAASGLVSSGLSKYDSPEKYFLVVAIEI